MASPQIEAQMLAWEAAQLAVACASSDAWQHATGHLPDCPYRDEALRLATKMQTTLGNVVNSLTAQKKEAA